MRYSCDMALIENSRARFDYSIIEEMEAGLELLGSEVKSLRAKHGSLKGARVVAKTLLALPTTSRAARQLGLTCRLRQGTKRNRGTARLSLRNHFVKHIFPASLSKNVGLDGRAVLDHSRSWAGKRGRLSSLQSPGS